MEMVSVFRIRTQKTLQKTIAHPARRPLAISSLLLAVLGRPVEHGPATLELG